MRYWYVSVWLLDVAQLATYDSIKRALISTSLFKDGVPLHLTCGLVAGTIATTVCAPVDVSSFTLLRHFGN